MRRAKILIVDDDPDILDILKLTLDGENYDVIQAANGEDALKLVQAKSPNLLILDYNMPRMNGKEICQKVKKDLLLQHLPIIMLTGKGEVVDKVQGIDAGADDYIVKPFEPKELLARIRMILRRTERDLEANPLSKLPGNIAILDELQNCIDKKLLFTVGYLDIDNFKSFNDKYGFKHGDEMIKETARILIKNVKIKIIRMPSLDTSAEMTSYLYLYRIKLMKSVKLLSKILIAPYQISMTKKAEKMAI